MNLEEFFKKHKLWLIGSKARERDSLTNVCLKDVNLRGVDLTNVCLKDAVLKYADLRCANLKNVDLRGADLRGSNLSGSKGLLSAIDYLADNVAASRANVEFRFHN